MTHNPWAREYERTPHSYVLGTEPSHFAHVVRDFVSPGARVLEVGCGEGRDSVFFAEHGCDVTSLDVSAAGLAKAERLARAHGVRVRWVRGDAAADIPRGPYDLVYSCGAIHYVPRSRRAHLFSRLKTETAPGGHHFHVVFTDRRVHVEMEEEIDYFTLGELQDAYADWAVLGLEPGLITCAQDGTRHTHSVEMLFARKDRVAES
jgi:tellurite methyltransferase